MAGSNTYTSQGDFTWTCPAGVTSVKVEVWGGGGGGGGGNAAAAAGGGGGGAFAQLTSYVTTPGANYNLTVGNGGGGAAANTNGTAGNNSVFRHSNNANAAWAQGGGGGVRGRNAGNGAAGTTANSSGNTTYAGGNGSSRNTTTTTYSGAGGGGAGSANAGTAGGNTAPPLAGGAGGTGGNVGGNGGNTVSADNGSTGFQAGGGGAGGAAANKLGGQGGVGKIVISWTSQNWPGNANVGVGVQVQDSEIAALNKLASVGIGIECDDSEVVEWRRALNVGIGVGIAATETVTASTPSRLLHTVKPSGQGGDFTTLKAAVDHLVASHSNLVSANVYADIEIDGDWSGVADVACGSDTSSITTDSTHYIHIYTTTTARHDGKWNDSKYRLVGNEWTFILRGSARTYVDGLQFGYSSAGDENMVSEVYSLSNCIFVLPPNNCSYGLRVNTDARIFNNSFYETGTPARAGIRVYSWGSANTVWIYNNTFHGLSLGVEAQASETPSNLKNNLFDGCSTDLIGAAANSYCSTTNDNTKGLSSGGTGNRFSQTFTFQAGTHNFHLAYNDAGAKGYGISDPGSGLFSDDIDGQTRVGSWDIGADQCRDFLRSIDVGVGIGISDSEKADFVRTASVGVTIVISTSSSKTGGLTTGTTCWGHSTGVTETNIRTFTSNWTGTGTISGSGDSEKLELDVGEYMESEVINTGSNTVTLLQNFYGSGDDKTLKYKQGDSEANCNADSWHTYSTPFSSNGFVKVRIEA